MGLGLECLPKQVDKYLKEEELKAEKNCQLKTRKKKIFNSINHSKHFLKINKWGDKFFSRYCTVIYLKSLSKEKSLFLGIKVGKKISKKATARNKMKRRIRHLVQMLTKDSLFQKMYVSNIQLDLLFVPRKDFGQVKFSSLTELLMKPLLKKIKYQQVKNIKID